MAYKVPSAKLFVEITLPITWGIGFSLLVFGAILAVGTEKIISIGLPSKESEIPRDLIHKFFFNGVVVFHMISTSLPSNYSIKSSMCKS
jgi:hypothetical protein